MDRPLVYPAIPQDSAQRRSTGDAGAARAYAGVSPAYSNGGGYDGPQLGYGSAANAGGYYVKGVQSIPNVNGYGGYLGGYGAAAIEYIRATR